MTIATARGAAAFAETRPLVTVRALCAGLEKGGLAEGSLGPNVLNFLDFGAHAWYTLVFATLLQQRGDLHQYAAVAGAVWCVHGQINHCYKHYECMISNLFIQILYLTRVWQ